VASAVSSFLKIVDYINANPAFVSRTNAIGVIGAGPACA
jgi:hypothetical protein